MANTQKAKGIVALSNYGIIRFSTSFVEKARVWPQQSVGTYPFFARPCPMKPRHGFVDSRLIRSEKEWLALVEEVKASKEVNAEIIMMPFIPCTWSGILTPAGVTLGAGHDGATSGHQAKQIPATSSSKEKFTKSYGLVVTADAANIKADPFVEFVEFNGQLEAVQLRDGTGVPLTDTCVPQTMTVKKIITANGEDLLEWEAKMKAEIALPETDGVVIHHPGGGMASHYAVQAIERSKHLPVPFAVWLKPEAPAIGSVIEQTSNAPAPLEEQHYKELAALIGFAVTNMVLDKEQRSDAIHLGVAALHASSFWGPERHLLALRAAGVTYMMRFASAAILGELRHWHGPGPGKSGKLRKTELFENPLATASMSRDQIYEKAFHLHMKHIAPRMATSYADFMAAGWGSSYGGKKWAECTKQTAKLFQATSAFLITPNASTWTEVMSAWNFVVNCFHNTGKLLNKFLSTEIFDVLAVVPSYGLVSELVGRIAINADDFGVHAQPEKVGQALAIKLSLPAKKKAAPLTMPDKFVARWKVQADGVYIQISLPAQVNKQYGMAQNFVLSAGMVGLLKTVKMDSTSLTGSTTPMCSGFIKFVDGAAILETENEYWVPLCGEDTLKSIFMKTHEEPDNNED